MTVVIGIKHKGDVYIGTDGRMTGGDKIATDKYLKQITSHGATFGVAGDIAVVSALKYILEVQLKENTNKIESENDIFAIYSELYNYLKDKGIIIPGEYLGLEAMIGTENNKLFYLNGIGDIFEVKKYKCAGSGGPTAEAILSQLIIKNPETEIKYVMKEVFKQHTGCGGKVTIKGYPGKRTKKFLLDKFKEKNE